MIQVPQRLFHRPAPRLILQSRRRHQIHDKIVRRGVSVPECGRIDACAPDFEHFIRHQLERALAPSLREFVDVDPQGLVGLHGQNGAVSRLTRHEAPDERQELGCRRADALFLILRRLPRDHGGQTLFGGGYGLVGERVFALPRARLDQAVRYRLFLYGSVRGEHPPEQRPDVVVYLRLVIYAVRVPVANARHGAVHVGEPFLEPSEDALQLRRRGRSLHQVDLEGRREFLVRGLPSFLLFLVHLRRGIDVGHAQPIRRDLPVAPRVVACALAPGHVEQILQIEMSHFVQQSGGVRRLEQRDNGLIA